MAIEETIGDFTFRSEKAKDGTYAFYRKFNNAIGTQFEEISLNEVPPGFVVMARSTDTQNDAIPAQNQAGGS